MKFIFQIGEETAQFPSDIFIQLNTLPGYADYINALSIIKLIIDAKISEYQSELDHQADLRMQEMGMDDVVDTEHGI